MTIKINNLYFTLKLDNVQIPLVKALMLDSHINLPKAFYSYQEFTMCKTHSEQTDISLLEWVRFHEKLLLSFSGEQEHNVICDNYKYISDSFGMNLTTVIEDISEGILNEGKINLLFYQYSMLHSFSVFNYLYSPDYINLNDNECELIDIMSVPKVLPYRVENRIKLLRLLIDNYYDIKNLHFNRNDEIYSFFYFDLIYSADDDLLGTKLKRKLLNEKKHRSRESLIEEKKFLENNWVIKGNLAQSTIDCTKNNSKKNALKMLNFICTEEEDRHKLDTKFFYFLGKLFGILQIDPGKATENSVNLMIKIYNFRRIMNE